MPNSTKNRTRVLDGMLGHIFKSVVKVTDDYSQNSLVFVSYAGASFLFKHEHDFCEDVYIEAVEGDLGDLLNSPLLVAQEAYCDGSIPGVYGTDFLIWTFYTFATLHGTVTVRWRNDSHGYIGCNGTISYFHTISVPGKATLTQLQLP